MHSKGISLIHKYEEGNDLDFNIGLYFYEKLCQKVFESPEGKKWRDDRKYKPSMPEMLTALVRKQELREKVDVDFDGRISFLEYLLYQYREFCNPADFIERSMRAALIEDSDAMKAAKAALEEVNAAIRAYEEEKTRLEADSKLPGVKGLAAKNLLAQLMASPLAEKLSAALIKAEAAVRIAIKEAEKAALAQAGKPTGGQMFWMNRTVEENKRRYVLITNHGLILAKGFYFDSSELTTAKQIRPWLTSEIIRGAKIEYLYARRVRLGPVLRAFLVRYVEDVGAGFELNSLCKRLMTFERLFLLYHPTLIVNDVIHDINHTKIVPSIRFDICHHVPSSVDLVSPHSYHI